MLNKRIVCKLLTRKFFADFSKVVDKEMWNCCRAFILLQSLDQIRNPSFVAEKNLEVTS